jgi:hypothetical protein
VPLADALHLLSPTFAITSIETIDSLFEEFTVLLLSVLVIEIEYFLLVCVSDQDF